MSPLRSSVRSDVVDQNKTESKHDETNDVHGCSHRSLARASYSQSMRNFVGRTNVSAWAFSCRSRRRCITIVNFIAQALNLVLEIFDLLARRVVMKQFT